MVTFSPPQKLLYRVQAYATNRRERGLLPAKKAEIVNGGLWAVSGRSSGGEGGVQKRSKAPVGLYLPTFVYRNSFLGAIVIMNAVLSLPSPPTTHARQGKGKPAWPHMSRSWCAAQSMPRGTYVSKVDECTHARTHAHTHARTYILCSYLPFFLSTYLCTDMRVGCQPPFYPPPPFPQARVLRQQLKTPCCVTTTCDRCFFNSWPGWPVEEEGRRRSSGGGGCGANRRDHQGVFSKAQPKPHWRSFIGIFFCVDWMALLCRCRSE